MTVATGKLQHFSDPQTDSTVFIIDDDPDVRSAINLLAKSVSLNSESYASARAFLDQFNPDQAGCLVLDVCMPGMTGLELQDELLANDVDMPIIIITAHGDVPMATRALRSGAFDFIQKPFSRHELLERINQAIELDIKNRERRAKRELLEARTADLSTRESEIMSMLVEGKSTKMIASQLNISSKTVDNHRAKVLDKMQVESVPELILLVVQNDECCSTPCGRGPVADGGTIKRRMR